MPFVCTRMTIILRAPNDILIHCDFVTDDCDVLFSLTYCNNVYDNSF